MTEAVMGPESGVTELLRSWRQGDTDARDRLFEQVYGVLHAMASARLGGGGDVTLRPTVLVHDALLRLMDRQYAVADGPHFLALAALKMRAVLVDHARARGAIKRGSGAINLTLSHADHEARTGSGPDVVDVLALHQALEDLDRHEPRAARAVEMVYFSGMSHSEIGAVLGVSIPTVERDLRFARAWLNRRLA
ncbi:ECF-type sigma factor [Luteimonas chenhongjianii]|uniref:ECF-type sigma factor n=1 Tax=Luteimonas chenhongjianii TaxID=2006110 RepID=UPI0012FD3E4B|nr:ECF-type sigma factor [Luteimonas chenhongjianii]